MRHQTTEGIVGHTLRWHYYVGLTYEDNNKIRMHWLTKIAIFCYFYTYVVQIVSLVQAKDDAEKFFQEFSIVSFCTVGLLKLNAFMRTQDPSWYSLLMLVKKIEEEELRNELSRVEYESDDDTEDTTLKFNKHMKIYRNRYQDIFRMIPKIYIISSAIYTMALFLEYGLMRLRSVHADWPHILPGFGIFHSKHLATYLVNIAAELIVAPFCVIFHAIFDTTTVAICIFIGGQFSLLREYSENIGGKGKVYNISAKRDQRAHYRIMRCHKIHVQLIIAMDGLKKLLHDLLGVYILIVTLTLCTIAVRVNTVISKIQLLSWMQYMCGSLIQLFLFCYYGDYIYNASSMKMGEGPYGCAYWCLSPQIRKELCLLGIGMSKPYRLLAGPFVSVDLSSFVQVVRGAYSFYAIIRK